MRFLMSGMIVFAVALAAPAGWSVEPVTPIDTLLVNPTAMHRKVFKLEGTAKNIAVYSGMENSTNRPLCGADFDLEDETGTIPVLYHVRCEASGQRAAVVGEGMRVVVDGYLDAPPTVLRNSDGKDFGMRFMGASVAPPKK